MKTLELNQMETIEGGGFWSGLTCGLTVFAFAAGVAGTGGLAALACISVCGLACAGALESEAVNVKTLKQIS